MGQRVYQTECKITRLYTQGDLVIGHSLIRTFLAGATKDAAICLVSEEQAQKKKIRIDLVLSKRMITFALDDEL